MDDGVEASSPLSLVRGCLLALVHALGVHGDDVAVEHLVPVPRNIIFSEARVHPLALLLILAQLQMNLRRLGFIVRRRSHVGGSLLLALLEVDVLVGHILVSLHHDVWRLSDEGVADLLVR